MSTRPQPHDVATEESVVGAALVAPQYLNDLVDTLDPTDFYDRNLGAIYATLLTLNAEARPIDQLTAAEALKAAGTLEEVGGRVRLSALASQVATGANAIHHGKQIVAYARRRRLIEHARLQAEAAHDPAQEPEAIAQTQSAALLDLSKNPNEAGAFASAAEILPAVSQALDTAQTSKTGYTGLDTGFPTYNQNVGGWSAPDLTIFAARPAIGKTALALQMAHAVASNGHGVGIFSLEMGQEQLVQRLICQEAGLDLNRLRRGRLDNDELRQFAAATARLASLPIYIDNTAGLHINACAAKARRLMQRHNIALWVGDYMQLMTAQGDSANERIGNISKGLKALAMDTKIPVLALSQLSREVEKRTDKMPQLSDLRDSGSLEQDADIVVFPYRPGAYGLRNPETGELFGGETRLLVAKNRSGPTGHVDLIWDGPSVSFREAPAIHYHRAAPPDTGRYGRNHEEAY